MKFRRLIFWLHLLAGVAGGIVIFIMSITGAILAYEKQIVSRLEGQVVVPSSSDAGRLSLEDLLAKVREAQSNSMPSMVTLRADPAAPVVFGFGRDRMVLVNPYTGSALESGPSQARS